MSKKRTEAAETVTETAESVTENTENVTENTENVTETAESVTENTENVTENTENVTETAENVTAAAVKKIYVGVSLPGMKSNTAISGEIPEKYDVPYVRDLFIPEDKFTEFLKKKSVTGSYEAFCYRKSAELAQSLNK